MKKLFCSAAVVWFAGFVSATTSFAGGDEVVVVYNSAVPESKALAEYYAQKRGVPADQLLGVTITKSEDVSRKEFDERLQQPLLKKIEAAKLWVFGAVDVPGTNGKPVHVEGVVVKAKVRYVVLCYGVPLRIGSEPDLHEPGEENLRAELRRNEACVDSELACLPRIKLKPLLAGPTPNLVYSTTNAAAISPTNGVLIVARLDGPTPEIARGLVDKALQAERDGLWGRAYIDTRGNVDANMKLGEDWIRATAEMCRLLGFETTVDTNGALFPPGFPMSHIAYYSGWYGEHVYGPFAQPTVEFMLGAFAYHLHSFSAASLRDTNRNWAGPLLARGVTCTMGSVFEPYLSGTPDVAVFTARWIFQSFTFGEAACASQNALSWMTTVVGDPLYHPFGQDAQKLHNELEQRGSPLVEWSHLRLVNLFLARGSSSLETSGYLDNLPLTKKSAVLSEKLADLYAAQGKPSSAVLLYQQALKLVSSPQQKIRLRFALGEKLASLDRNAEAYEDYQKLLDEAPDYADKPVVYRKLLALAQKLEKRDDAAKWSKELNLTNSAAK
ncbi:MAG: TIGR03790 family protein [Verrucomicrobia bacterium]|nr:MAG: TIGR03790 family protein [Verrucomicrobiota bacterium]